MNKTTYTVTRFNVSYDFYVEVTEENDVVNFVLCRENFDVKLFMFGLDKKDAPPETWEKLILNNADGYILIFIKEYSK